MTRSIARTGPTSPLARVLLAVLVPTLAFGVLPGCSGESDSEPQSRTTGSSSAGTAETDAVAAATGADTSAQPPLATNRPQVPAVRDAANAGDVSIPTSRISVQVYSITLDPAASIGGATGTALAAELGDFLGASSENVLSRSEAAGLRELLSVMDRGGIAGVIASAQISAPLGIAAERALATRAALGTDLTLLVTPTAVSSSDNEPAGSVRVAYTVSPVAQDIALTTRLASFDPGPVTSVARRAVAAPGETVYTARSVAETGIDVLVLMTFE